MTEKEILYNDGKAVNQSFIFCVKYLIVKVGSWPQKPISLILVLGILKYFKSSLTFFKKLPSCNALIVFNWIFSLFSLEFLF